MSCSAPSHGVLGMAESPWGHIYFSQAPSLPLTKVKITQNLMNSNKCSLKIHKLKMLQPRKK